MEEDTVKKALINEFYKLPMTGEEVESRSMEIIDQRVGAHNFSPEEWQVVRRMIHTTADFSLMADVKFAAEAIQEGIKALREGRPVYTDSNMIRAGLSIARLKAVNQGYAADKIVCCVADEDIVLESKKSGLPRSILGIRKAKKQLDGGIAMFGNAPLALMELSRLIIEEKIRPAFVIAMPVGFVHVAESKDEFLSLGVPGITLTGLRGGSTLAVSVLHAVAILAGSKENKEAQSSKGTKQDDLYAAPQNRSSFDAVILIGHGSKKPNAAMNMEEIARQLKQKYSCWIVEPCYMSLNPPYFPEVLKKCVGAGAKRIMVAPYFLHDGVHINHDIPDLIREGLRQNPGIEIFLGKPIGFDESIVDLVWKRICECKP